MASFFCGILTGIINHAGLWWTVRSLPASRTPMALSMASFYLRLLTTGFVFIVFTQNEWPRLLACFLGFLTARQAALWLLSPRRPCKGTVS